MTGERTRSVVARRPASVPNLSGHLPAGVHNSRYSSLRTQIRNHRNRQHIQAGGSARWGPLKGKPLTATIKAGAEFEPVMKSFAISSAADGDYEVRATLTQSGKSAQTTGEFALTGHRSHTDKHRYQ